MNRKKLDAFAAHYGLTPEGVEAMLSLADARPTDTDVARFGVKALRLAGVLSLAAGVVFLVAANWSVLAVLGRFVLVEALLAVAVGVAIWRPPPLAVGRYSLLMAFVVTGALFALYGQTYQTGADVYELFLNWALLGLPLAIAAQWSVVWAAWVLVLNVALALFCGARPDAGLFWVVFSPWDLRQSQLLVWPLLVNAALWWHAITLERSRWARLAPAWLARFALACCVAYGTWAAMIVIVRSDRGDEGFLGLVVPLVVLGAVAWHTLRRRVDVFPLAVIEASLLVLSTTAIVEYTDLDEIGIFFVIAVWLIVASTLSGRYLMRLVREWDAVEASS